MPQPQPGTDQVSLNGPPVLIEEVEEAVYSPWETSR